MNIKELKEKALSLTMEPGVYLMKNNRGEIIYVGKAKALKNRVVSYFRTNSSHNEKVRKMVSLVCDFDYIVTSSEFEALILECSLIKQYSPKYNILLKDDKGYHYIHISDEDFPRITAALQKKETGTHIGPFTSSFVVKQTVEQTNKIFNLPTCKRKFPEDFKKGRPCLNFHIKQCMGLCQGKISKEKYAEILSEAVNYIHNGKTVDINKMQKDMELAAENLEFEKAARIRDRINAIRKATDSQTVMLPENRSMDVWGFAENLLTVCAVVIKFRDGHLYDKEHFFFDEVYSVSDLKEEFLTRYYADVTDFPKAVIIPSETSDMALFSQFLSHRAGRNVTVSVPLKGERKKLSEMAYQNAAEQLSLRVKRTGKEVTALEELARLLNLDKTPGYIEAYDISNWGDTAKVGGMIVFENGRPLRSDYKRFAIKEIATQDDYASMKEVIRRRFTRYKMGDPAFSKLPDLILLDGGKGHVSAVEPVLKELQIDVPLFGMVKDSRHRTHAITKTDEIIAINTVKSAFTLVTNIQDEVHRFAISYQRSLHKKVTYESELLKVKGIGKAKLKALMKKFKTKKGLKEASLTDIQSTAKISEETAKELFEVIQNL